MYSLVKSSMINTLSGVISLVAGFGSTILIARLLGAEGTGLTAFSLWLVFSGCALADRGIPAIIMRYLPRTLQSEDASPSLVRQLYRRFIWPVLLGGIAFTAYGFSGFAQDYGHSGAFWLITAVFFLIYCHAQLSISASFAVGNYVGPAKRVAIGCLLQLPAVAIGAYWFGAAGAMAGYLVRHLPQALSVRSCLRPEPSMANVITGKMLDYGRHSWLSTILVILVRTRVEFLFIGWFFSLTEVGYFAAGITFTSLVNQLSLSMTAGMMPKFGHLNDSGEKEQLEKVYQRVLRWMAFLMLPVSLGGAVIMQAIIPLIMGPEFEPAVPTATILMLFVFGGSLAAVPIMLLQACEKSRLILLLNGISAAALVILNLALTPIFGGVAAALIKGVVSFAGLGVGLWYCQARLGFSSGFVILMKSAVSAVACALTAWAIMVQLDGLSGVLIAVPTAAIVYMIAIRLTGALPYDDLEIVGTTVRSSLPASLASPALKLLSLVGKPQGQNQ